MTGTSFPNFTTPKWGKRCLSPIFAAALLGAAYYLYSRLCEGFYQHDEAAHFLNMLDFWRSPSLILGNWAKPGYKILFVLPALLGHRAVIVLQCLVAASACLLAARLASTLGSPRPGLSFLLLAFQPFWLQLSFRCYSESWTAVVLLSALLMHYRKRPGPAALLLSFATTIRQEMFILAALYALSLLFKKRFLSALLLLAFPLLLHLWGGLATGDPLYLWNAGRIYAAETLRAYPRAGFDHYFVMAPAIFGHIALLLAVTYIILVLLKRLRPEVPLLAAAGTYFLVHCLLNLQAFPLGAATAGNLRYMNVIAPLAAILGNLAADRVLSLQPRRALLPFLVGYAACIGVFCTFRHANWIYLLDQRDWMPLLLALIACAGIYVLREERRFLGFVLACSLLFAAVTVRPIGLSPEDRAARDAASWMRAERLNEGSVLYNHVLARYFCLLAGSPGPGTWQPLDRRSLADAPAGTIVLWDSHYSNRTGNMDGPVTLDTLTSDSSRFQTLRSFRSDDGRFALFAFRKVVPHTAQSPP